jgi:hypothetical protein
MGCGSAGLVEFWFLSEIRGFAWLFGSDRPVGRRNKITLAD